MARVVSACVGLVVLAAIGGFVLRDDAPPQPGRADGDGVQAEPFLKTKGVARKPEDESALVDVAALRAGFASDDPEVRKVAYATAAQAKRLPFDEEFVKQMVGWLESHDKTLAHYAIVVLLRMGPQGEPLVQRVITLLDTDDFELQVRAAATLGKLGPAGAPGLPALLGLVHDETLTPGSAAGIFMAIGAAAERALLADLRGQDADGRKRLLQVLSAFEGRSAFALDAVAPYLSSKDASLRMPAVWTALAALDRPRGAEVSNAEADPALRAKVRELVEGLADDPNDAIRRRVRGELAWLEQIER